MLLTIELSLLITFNYIQYKISFLPYPYPYFQPYINTSSLTYFLLCDAHITTTFMIHVDAMSPVVHNDHNMCPRCSSRNKLKLVLYTQNAKWTNPSNNHCMNPTHLNFPYLVNLVRVMFVDLMAFPYAMWTVPTSSSSSFELHWRLTHMVGSR